MNDVFSNIIGHDRAVKRLRLMLANGTMPHAILFIGRRHLGKRTLAMALAGALLGGRPDTHPDFRLVGRGRDDKTDKLRKNIPVDDVRDLREHLRTSALMGGRKVAIIDEAETLSEEAGNALLKSLEEPAPSSVVILIAHDASRVLPTVLSRCAVIPLSRVSDEEIAATLASDGLAAPEAAEFAAYADGRPGIALGLRQDADMLHWYKAESGRWRSLETSTLHQRFTLVSGLAPAGGDREEAVLGLYDTISFWETALRRALHDGRPEAPKRIRALMRLKKSLETNVQPRLLLERFTLSL